MESLKGKPCENHPTEELTLDHIIKEHLKISDYDFIR